MEVQSKCTVCYLKGVENAGELNVSAQDCCVKLIDLV